MLAHAGLEVVALDEVSVVGKTASVALQTAAPATQNPGRDVALTSLGAMHQRLVDLKIDYVFLMTADAFTVDRDFRGLVVRTSDMRVIASTWLKQRIFAAVAVTTTLAMGLSLLVLPWYALVDTDARKAEVGERSATAGCKRRADLLSFAGACQPSVFLKAAGVIASSGREKVSR